MEIGMVPIGHHTIYGGRYTVADIGAMLISIPFSFQTSVCHSKFRVSHRCLFPMHGQVKCALQYNRCYTLGANWDRQGDPIIASFLGPAKRPTRLRSPFTHY